MGGDFKRDEDSSVGSRSPALEPAASVVPPPAGHLEPSDLNDPSHLQQFSNFTGGAYERSSATISEPGLDHPSLQEQNRERYRHLQARVDDEDDEYMEASGDMQEQTGFDSKVEEIYKKENEMYDQLDNLRQQLNGLLPEKELGPEELLKEGTRLDQMRRYARRLFYEEQRLSRYEERLASRENEISNREISLNVSELSLNDHKRWNKHCQLQLIQYLEREIARVGSSTPLNEVTLGNLKDAIMAKIAKQQVKPPEMAIRIATTPFETVLGGGLGPDGLKYPSEITGWHGIDPELNAIYKQLCATDNHSSVELDWAVDQSDRVNPELLALNINSYLAHLHDNQHETWEGLGLGYPPKLECVNVDASFPNGTTRILRKVTHALCQIGGHELPILAGEYTSPASLTSTQMRAGLDREILPENEIIGQHVSGAEVASRRELTIAISRLYTYMVGRGIRFGFITNSECCILLRISNVDPKRVEHGVWNPAPEHATGYTTERFSSIIKTLLVYAMAQPLPSEQWYEGLTSVPTWPTEVVSNTPSQPSVRPSAPSRYNGNQEMSNGTITATFENCFNSRSSQSFQVAAGPNGPAISAAIHNGSDDSLNNANDSQAPNISSENFTRFNNSFNGNVNPDGTSILSTTIKARFSNCFLGTENRSHPVLDNVTDATLDNCFNDRAGPGSTSAGSETDNHTPSVSRVTRVSRVPRSPRPPRPPRAPRAPRPPRTPRSPRASGRSVDRAASGRPFFDPSVELFASDSLEI